MTWRQGTRCTGVALEWVMLALAAQHVPRAQEPVEIERGIEVYADQRCSLCHSIAGDGNQRGPLDGVGTKLSPDDIERWIVAPKEMTEETGATRRPPMRAYPDLPADDLEALVAYMVSLKAP